MTGLGVTAIGLVNHATADCARRNEPLRPQIAHCTFHSATLKLVFFANTIGDFDQVFAPLLSPSNELCSDTRLFDRSESQNSDGCLWNSRNAGAGTNEDPQKWYQRAASGPRKENFR